MSLDPPVLCVSSDRVHWRAFRLDQEEVVIGRDDEAEVCIDHSSVSRFHARLVLEDGKALLEDLESSNGTWLGKQRIHSARLHNGAIFRVGSRVFVFASDPTKAMLPDGRSVSYLSVESLPRPRRVGAEDATVAMAKGTARVSAEAVRRMLQQDEAWMSGALVSADGARRWVLGSKENRLGWNTEVPVRGWAFGGWLGKGHGAVIQWRHNHHVIVCTAFFASVRVNGRPVTERRLRHGDRLKVGKTAFRYVAR